MRTTNIFFFVFLIDSSRRSSFLSTPANCGRDGQTKGSMISPTQIILTLALEKRRVRFCTNRVPRAIIPHSFSAIWILSSRFVYNELMTCVSKCSCVERLAIQNNIAAKKVLSCEGFAESDQRYNETITREVMIRARDLSLALHRPYVSLVFNYCFRYRPNEERPTWTKKHWPHLRKVNRHRVSCLYRFNKCSMCASTHWFLACHTSYVSVSVCALISNVENENEVYSQVIVLSVNPTAAVKLLVARRVTCN